MKEGVKIDNEKRIEAKYGYKRGDRVSTYLIEDKKKKLILFGFGVYEGCAIPEAGDEFVADLFKKLNGIPKIKLDSGQIIWGFECWWCTLSEFEKIQQTLIDHGYKVIKKEWKGK